jgi:COP9 signalosome complex subunit 3
MTRLDPTTGTFTLTHLHFIRLCVETRAYSAAQPILDNYIHSIASKIPQQVREDLEYSVVCAEHTNSGDYIHQGSGHTDRITLVEVQEYYLLGAMAYIGTGQFKKAMEFLEHVLVVPANNVANGLMLEAYKKWVLVSCLVNGSVSEPPICLQPRLTNNSTRVHRERRTDKPSRWCGLRRKRMRLLPTHSHSSTTYQN